MQLERTVWELMNPNSMPFCVQEAGPTLEQVTMSYINSNLILLCVMIKMYRTALCLDFLHL